jgi:hypothetical protein
MKTHYEWTSNTEIIYKKYKTDQKPAVNKEYDDDFYGIMYILQIRGP